MNVSRWIRAFFAAFLVLHGLIHLIGFSKAFGFVAVPQLGQPISRVEGLVWLVATGLFVASAVALYASPRRFWMVGAAALVLSQTLICGSWRDAKFGAQCPRSLSSSLASGTTCLPGARRPPGHVRERRVDRPGAALAGRRS